MSTETASPSGGHSPLSHEQQMWRWRVLLATYFGYGGYYLTRKVFTICKTTLADEFNWELGDTAHIWTAFLVAYMLGQFLNSYLGRRWGSRTILLGGLAISIVFNIVFGFANSYKTFVVFMFFNGLVQATGWPGSVGSVSSWLRPWERGTFMGFWSTSYQIGNITVKWLGGVLLESQLGWRWSFWGCTLVTFVIWWALYLWQRNKPEDVGLAPILEERREDQRTVRASEAEHLTFSQYLQVALNPIVLLMGCSYFCIKFLRYALDSWLPAFLNIQGLDVGAASYYSSLFDGAGIVGVVVTGFVLDRVFRGNWAVLCFVMAIGMIAGYLAVIYLATGPVMVALCFGFVGFMLYGPDSLVCGVASVEVAGEKNGVAVVGLVNGVGSIGPVIQEEVIGLLIKKNAAFKEGFRGIDTGVEGIQQAMDAGTQEGLETALAAVQDGMHVMHEGMAKGILEQDVRWRVEEGFAGLEQGIASVQDGLLHEGLASLQDGLSGMHACLDGVLHAWLLEGIRNANFLALGMSVLFAVLMLVVIGRVRAARKRNAAQPAG